MKIFFLSMAIAMSLATSAQIKNVSLQASGLTCSMCSNAINKALRTLDFIASVDADIKTYTFELSFKADREVDFDKIKAKVEDAGFSVSGFNAVIYFNKVQVKNSEPVMIGDKTFYFSNIQGESLDGWRQIRLLNKGFVSSKEFKRNPIQKKATAAGVYYATL